MATGVVADTYGDSTNVGQFTVDATGRITFAQNVAISGGSGGGAVPAGANRQIQFNNNGAFGASINLTWNGSQLYANNILTEYLAVADGPGATVENLRIGTSGGSLNQVYIYNTYPNREFKILTTAGSPITFRNATASNALMLGMNPNASIDLYFNGAKKLATTSTGVEVTGNVRAAAGSLQVSNNTQPSFTTGFQAPTTFTQSVTYKLPPADGSNNQVLSTNGAASLSWVSTVKLVTAPASSSTPGNNNEIAFDGVGNFYFYQGGQWWKVAGSSF
jgi:hypothetical protein